MELRRKAIDPETLRIVADFRSAVELQHDPSPRNLVAIAVSRMGNIRQELCRPSIWIQMRGSSRIVAAEGRFTLARGDWIAFDAESRPELQAGRANLTIGILLPSRHADAAFTALDQVLLPGRGHMPSPDARIALRLWRVCVRESKAIVAPSICKPLLLHLQYVQRELHALTDRCPGRSVARRNQVLMRMQRARMLLEGNVHRSVRLDELAQLTRFSGWRVSKIFHEIYGETVQQASIRLRMQRALELLARTSLSISELGDACGFHDPCSFARLFRRCHGQTASRWRAQHQARDQTIPSQTPGSPAAIERTST